LTGPNRRRSFAPLPDPTALASSQPRQAHALTPAAYVLNPESQSFSRSYGSILPTSLTYIVLSTRGCSPWRPDAVMSTTWGIQISPEFSRADESAPDTSRRKVLCQPIKLYLRVIRFQSLRNCQTEKKTLPRAPADVFGFAYVAIKVSHQVREYEPDSLSIGGAASAHFQTEFPYLLGSTNPCPNAVHMEPFSTSVFKVLV
jgi:hypothetical protein